MMGGWLPPETLAASAIAKTNKGEAMNAEAMNAEADEYISRLHDENSQLRVEIERLKIENDKLNRKIHAAVVYGQLPS